MTCADLLERCRDTDSAPRTRAGSRRAAALALLLFAQPVLAQGSNLSFEQHDTEQPNLPAYWALGGLGSEFHLDTTLASHGRQSLRVLRVYTPFATAGSQFLPPTEVAGRSVRISGDIRTEGLEQGHAGFWIRVEGPDGPLAVDIMRDGGAGGTSAWQRYGLEMRVDPEATGVVFGPFLSGSGTAWYDDLRIEIDGKHYEAQAYGTSSDAERVELIRANGLPFTTDAPGGSRADLAGFKPLFRDAQIVALGEASHGTREFFRMKHRLTELLVGELGFTIFAIEASAPHARVVNRYVLEGIGDARLAVEALGFWTWKTQEVLELIEWMREFNRGGKGRVEFWGFDIVFGTAAMDSVLAFVARVDSRHLDQLTARYAGARALAEAGQGGVSQPAVRSALASAELALEHLRAREGEYRRRSSDVEVDWALRYARLAIQPLEYLDGGDRARDLAMAENAVWIQDRAGRDTRMILWAHNGHVHRRGGWLGGHLAERYQHAYVAVGFTFHRGVYRASGIQGIESFAAVPGPASSLERVLFDTELPRFALDLRSMRDVPEAAWLQEYLPFRWIGSMYDIYGFRPARVGREYDVLVFFADTNPALPLGEVH